MASLVLLASGSLLVRGPPRTCNRRDYMLPAKQLYANERRHGLDIFRCKIKYAHVRPSGSMYEITEITSTSLWLPNFWGPASNSSTEFDPTIHPPSIPHPLIQCGRRVTLEKDPSLARVVYELPAASFALGSSEIERPRKILETPANVVSTPP